MATDTSGKHYASREVRVSCFDNVKLVRAGEYIVRGAVENCSYDEGVFEPMSCVSAKGAHEALVVATSVVRRDGRSLIPIRLLTLRDNVHLKKGSIIGTLRGLEPSVGPTVNMRAISLEKNERWKILEPKFENQLSCMSNVRRNRLLPLLQEFADIFSISKSDIGLTGMVAHAIDTGNEKPICAPYRRIPLALEEKVDNMIKELEEKGIIRPSVSPWNAPLVVVPKKNGDIRLTVDFRRLNSITERPVFPMPDARALLDTLSGSAYFTTLDLSSGYYNIPMKEEDVQKTAFSTRRNHWEFVRMPMGLSTAPASFQRLMHMVFHKENWRQCLIYLDDILIFADDMEEHLRRMRVIFERIREAGLKLSPDKCSFLQTKVSYLGYTISKDGTHTDQSKIDKITSWPLPKTIDELRSFLGLCGYYRQFIDNYAKMVIPLEEVCKPLWNKKTGKGKRLIELNQEQEESFMKLKQALTTAPVLAFPTKNDQFILDTDASHDAIGCVLSQRQGGKEKVIAYASKKLSQSERQYCITRKELLAVYHFVTHFKHYLLGHKFIVRTDHRALTWMLNWKRPNTGQYCRWKEELEIFDMQVQFRPGNQHLNADALSRLPNCEQCELPHSDPKRKKNVKILNKEDEDRLCCRRILMFESNLNQEDDPSLKRIIKLLKTEKLNEREPDLIKFENEECKMLWAKRRKLRFRGDLLYFVTENGSYKLIIPTSERKNMIKLTHETLAHIGVKKTLHFLHEKYYWYNMDFDVRLFIASCKSCAERKSVPIKKHSRNSLSGAYPFEKVSVDITGPLPTGAHGEKYILGIIDNFSKYPSLIPLKNATAKEVAQAIYKNWITVFGVPKIIHTDRGTEFENQLITDLCKLLGVRKSRSSPYYPQGDGMIERLFRTVKDMTYATAKSKGKNWVDVIPSVEMGLRCSQTQGSKITPYETVFGRKMTTPLNYDRLEKCRTPLISDYVKDIRNTLEEIHGKIRKTNKKAVQVEDGQQFKVGEIVFAKIFPTRKGIDLPRYNGPYEIVNIKGEWCYVLKNCKTGQIVERNHYHVKKYKGKVEVRKEGEEEKNRFRSPTSIWSATKHTKIGDNHEENPRERESQVNRHSCEKRKLPEVQRRSRRKCEIPDRYQ